MAWAASDVSYADGTYEGVGKGIGGDVPVTVTIKDGRISDVTVGDNSETQGIGSKAIEKLPDEIVAANGTDGVDGVSGASVTSKAIFTAVGQALESAEDGTNGIAESASESARAESESVEKARAAIGSYADGTYEGTGKGIGGDVPVTVTIKGGKIADVTVGDNSETQGIGSKAIEELPSKIVAANGTDGVDGVSGASVTSKAIFVAVDDCLEQARVTVASTTPSSRSDSATSSSAVSVPDTSDHLGTVHFGGLSVTIPDGYKCASYTDESDTTKVSVGAAYASDSTSTFLIMTYIGSDSLHDAVHSAADAENVVKTLMKAPLANDASDWAPLDDGYELKAAKDGCFGAYTVQYKGVGEVTIIVCAVFDSNNNLLLIEGIPFSKEGVDEILSTMGSTSGMKTLDSDSSIGSFANQGTGSLSTHSSYTPTRGEQNALETAHDYLNAMAFSASGLKHQLEFEGYTSDEADYAVENCGANWDEQARLMAREYLNSQAFSRKGLIEQLEYEGFTYSQASTAATSVGL